MATRPRRSAEPASARRRAGMARAAVITIMLASVATSAAAVVWRRKHPGQILWIDVGMYAVVYLSAAVLLLAASDDQPQRARGWRWLGLAMIASAGGNAWFSLVTRHSSTPDAPSLADVFDLARYPLTYLGIFALLRGSAVRPQAGQALDGLVAGLGAAALVVATVIGGSLAPGGGSVLQVLVNLAYPVGDLLLLLVLAAGGSVIGSTLSRSAALLAVGLGVNAVADLVYLVQQASDAYVEGGWLDQVWLVGTAAIGLAPGLAQGRPVAGGRHRTPRLAFAAPAVFALLSVLVIGLQQAGLVCWQAAVPADAAVLVAVVRAALGVRELQHAKAHELAELERLANTDELTGLPNRRAFREHLREALQAPPARPVSLLVLDVDRFKDVNDSLSHSAGDHLLVELGERISAVLGPDDVVGRLGGDEFAIVTFGDSSAGLRVAQAVHAALAEPFTLEDLPVHVDLSIGVASAMSATETAAALLRMADLAMYRAKRRHLGTCVHDLGHEPARDRLHLTEQLRAALRGQAGANGRVVVQVQPQVSLRTQGGVAAGELVGVEALARWQHPDEGLLLPGAFLPMAETAGLLGLLLDVVLDGALDACRGWWVTGRQLPVAVNVGASDALSPDFAVRIIDALQRHGLPPRALVLELTEDALIADPAAVRAVMTSLQARGVQFSIDDFGSGYSSLAYLRELPVQELKLDRTFVADLAADPSPGSSAAAIVRTTADLAHSLGLRVVAEGVEDDDTLRVLRMLDCDVVQGFHVAEPMPPERLRSWLDRWAARDRALPRQR
ncbi:MAG TPA: EAL domain-containing protein [Kineosporiaceae bacterium]